MRSEHWSEKPEGVGSIPTSPTNIRVSGEIVDASHRNREALLIRERVGVNPTLPTKRKEVV